MTTSRPCGHHRLSVTDDITDYLPILVEEKSNYLNSVIITFFCSSNLLISPAAAETGLPVSFLDNRNHLVMIFCCQPQTWRFLAD
uniref:Uncharacterized protein n=1 Tax=Poecilia mexicana TaxID=48701 RepID=A0A3B3YC32_9TELE